MWVEEGIDIKFLFLEVVVVGEEGVGGEEEGVEEQQEDVEAPGGKEKDGFRVKPRILGRLVLNLHVLHQSYHHSQSII